MLLLANREFNEMSHVTSREKFAKLRQSILEENYGDKLTPVQRVVDAWSANELTNSLLKQMDGMPAQDVRQFLADNRDCVRAIARHNPVRKIHLENYIPYREAELKFRESMSA